MAAPKTDAVRVQEEQIKASREASEYFNQLDRSTLYGAIPLRNVDWLLGEMEDISPHVPIGGFSLPRGGGSSSRQLLQQQKIAIFVPIETSATQTPLRLAELSRVLWELTVGVYVFNTVPGISLQTNHDCSSSVVIPPAYRDGIIGTALFQVDYFVKSLLHGTTIPLQRQREEIAAAWKKVPSGSLRQTYRDLGMVYMMDDPELGHEIYEPKKAPFIRHPPMFVDSELAHSELTPRLTTGEEFDRQADHVHRDVFLRFLDNVAVSLVVAQRTIQQNDGFFVLDPAVHITTSVTGLAEDPVSSDLTRHLTSYLQCQHDFVAEHLRKKKEIAHYVDLLSFASFAAQLLVTLKHHKKIVSFSNLPQAKTGKVLQTSHEVPPVLPSETSRWSPFTATNTCSSLHGGIVFHLPRLDVSSPDAEFDRVYRELKAAGGLDNQKELATCEVQGKPYYIMEVTLEDYYPRSPKLPRWVHSFITELKSQSARLPSLNHRIQELLRRSYGSREAARLQTVPVQLLAAIKRGLFPLASLLIKRCTKTHLKKLDDAGWGLVHYAASHAHADILSLLVHAGCSVDQEIEGSSTQPIHLAAKAGDLETLSCLLHFEADVVAVDGYGWAPVHYSASHNYNIVVVHLCTVERECIELQTGDRAASTPILLAAKNGGFDTVKALVDLGADVSVVDGNGHGIVQLSALHHHLNILRYLVDLAGTEPSVFHQLSEMLRAEETSGYPEAAARSLDPLTQWRTSQHAAELLEHAAIPALVKLLTTQSNDKIQHLSVQVLANVSSESTIRSALVEANGVPPLVALLGSPSERVQSCASLILSDLISSSPDVQASVLKAGAVSPLVKLLESDTDDVQLFATACLATLARDSTPNQSSIASASALEALKPLLSSDLSCIQACASCAIRSTVEENRNCQLRSLSVDLLPSLVCLLRSKEVSVHTEAALAIEAVVENCPEAQGELLGNAYCITLLKRLLRMRSPAVKVAGGRALWAIAGHLISHQRVIAAHMGLSLLVSMLTIHNEKLDYVCSEALGALATELGDNQEKIMEGGGVKPLIEVLTLPTSQRVYLSAINTVSKLIVIPGLRPNKVLQREVVKSKGLTILAGLACSERSTEIVRVSAICTLAMLCLESLENISFLLSNTEFSLKQIFNFLSSSDPTVQIRAAQSLATLVFNNRAQLEELRQSGGSIHVDFFLSFLESDNESFKCYVGFQLVVLSKLLIGLRDAEAIVKGIRTLVGLLSSEIESTQVLSSHFIGCLAHSGPGIPQATVMAGALDLLISNLTSGSGPVIESCCVALGYFSFDPMAARLMMGMFRDQPEKFDVFREFSSSVVVSKTFMYNWDIAEQAGLPVLSLEARGGPPATQGWKIPRNHSPSRNKAGKTKMATSLCDPSTQTLGTEFKSHSTLQKESVAEIFGGPATTTITAAALPNPAKLAPPTETRPLPPSRGLLTSRKIELDSKKAGSKGRHQDDTISKQITSKSPKFITS